MLYRNRGDSIFRLYVYGLGRKVARTKKACKSRLDFVILILNYQTGHVPCEHNISVIIEFTLEYGSTFDVDIPSFNGFINDPGFDGVDTKPQNPKTPKPHGKKFYEGK